MGYLLNSLLLICAKARKQKEQVPKAVEHQRKQDQRKVREEEDEERKLFERVGGRGCRPDLIGGEGDGFEGEWVAVETIKVRERGVETLRRRGRGRGVYECPPLENRSGQKNVNGKQRKKNLGSPPNPFISTNRQTLSTSLRRDSPPPTPTTPQELSTPALSHTHATLLTHLSKLDLNALDQILRILLKDPEFTDSALRRAAVFMVNELLPRFSYECLGEVAREIEMSTGRIWEDVGVLLEIYGVKHPNSSDNQGSQEKNSIPIPGQERKTEDAMGKWRYSIESNASDGLSSSYKNLMRETKPEDIPVHWGLGGRELFHSVDDGAGGVVDGNLEWDGEVDVLCPGRTYPVVCFGMRDCRVGWENEGKGEESQKRGNYRSATVESVEDSGD